MTLLQHNEVRKKKYSQLNQIEEKTEKKQREMDRGGRGVLRGGLRITCDSSSSRRWRRKGENDRRETSRWLTERFQMDVKRLVLNASEARNTENPKTGVSVLV